MCTCAMPHILYSSCGSISSWSVYQTCLADPSSWLVMLATCTLHYAHYNMQSTHVAKCTCCKVHALQIARVAKCTCCSVHMLQSVHVEKCLCCKVQKNHHTHCILTLNLMHWILSQCLLHIIPYKSHKFLKPSFKKSLNTLFHKFNQGKHNLGNLSNINLKNISNPKYRKQT